MDPGSLLFLAVVAVCLALGCGPFLLRPLWPRLAARLSAVFIAGAVGAIVGLVVLAALSLALRTPVGSPGFIALAGVGAVAGLGVAAIILVRGRKRPPEVPS